jgi:hypothetical protein
LAREPTVLDDATVSRKRTVGRASAEEAEVM